jgi:hypothetical protein
LGRHTALKLIINSRGKLSDPSSDRKVSILP